MNRTPELFKHKTRLISFTLVVDDFGVKYVNLEDAKHLEHTLKTYYPIKSDWIGDKYIGIDLDWNYQARTLRTSMKGYIKKALKQFQHPNPSRHTYGPEIFVAPTYGKAQQMTTIDSTPQLDPPAIKDIQKKCGKFLYIARAIDNTMLHALNKIAIATTKGTEKTANAVTYFLNYCAFNPEPSLLYRASDMILSIDSDAAYLVEPQARSRMGGYHYLGNKDGKLFNAPIHVLAKVIQNVVASAAEAEVAGL